jgi:hypothetical protein
LAKPYLEKSHHKKGLVDRMAQGVGPEFKPQYYTKQNKNPQIIL